jgi:hypothetical protein
LRGQGCVRPHTELPGAGQSDSLARVCRSNHSPCNIFRFMGKIGYALTCVIALGTISGAQTVTLTLQKDLSSKLPTGTAFTARDAGGKVYNGHIVAHPAQRFLRRGSMILVFEDPVVPVTKDREGVFRAGNKMRLLKFGGSLAAAKLADDAVDGAIGATRARYVAAAVSAALIIFQKGGEAALHKGDTIEVEPRRPARWKSDRPTAEFR